jgi:hypothetical protein
MTLKWDLHQSRVRTYSGSSMISQTGRLSLILFYLLQIQQIKNEIISEQQKSKEESLLALQNANEDKRRTINEYQMRIQDLTTQLQRLEAKGKENTLEQKLQLEKEHLVNLIDTQTTIV